MCVYFFQLNYIIKFSLSLLKSYSIFNFSLFNRSEHYVSLKTCFSVPYPKENLCNPASFSFLLPYLLSLSNFLKRHSFLPFLYSGFVSTPHNLSLSVTLLSPQPFLPAALKLRAPPFLLWRPRYRLPVHLFP